MLIDFSLPLRKLICSACYYSNSRSTLELDLYQAVSASIVILSATERMGTPSL